MNCGFGGKIKTQSFQKLFSGGHLFVFVEYLCNRSPKIKTKNIKKYSSILAIVNHRNWLYDSPPLKIEDLYTLEVDKLTHKFSRKKLSSRFSSFFYSNKCHTHTNHPFGILLPKSLYSVLPNCKNAKIL